MDRDQMTPSAADPSEADLSAADLDLLTDVLDVNPSMHSTVYAVKIIEQRVGYPLADPAALAGAFRGRAELRVRNCRITARQVEEYLPGSCFPIHNRQELISQLIMAFERERMSVMLGLASAQGRTFSWKGQE
jgi:hypothetical protein